jgi:hypothetical protein
MNPANLVMQPMVEAVDRNEKLAQQKKEHETPFSKAKAGLKQILDNPGDAELAMRVMYEFVPALEREAWRGPGVCFKCSNPCNATNESRQWADCCNESQFLSFE